MRCYVQCYAAIHKWFRKIQNYDEKEKISRILFFATQTRRAKVGVARGLRLIFALSVCKDILSPEESEDSAHETEGHV